MIENFDAPMNEWMREKYYDGQRWRKLRSPYRGRGEGVVLESVFTALGGGGPIQQGALEIWNLQDS